MIPPTRTIAYEPMMPSAVPWYRSDGDRISRAESTAVSRSVAAAAKAKSSYPLTPGHQAPSSRAIATISPRIT